jgi:hypothetical protein
MVIFHSYVYKRYVYKRYVYNYGKSLKSPFIVNVPMKNGGSFHRFL